MIFWCDLCTKNSIISQLLIHKMSKYSIPVPFRKGFVILSKTDFQLIQEVADILKPLPAGMGIENITKNIKVGLGDKMGENDIEEIIRAFFSLVRFSKENAIDFNEFIEDITESITISEEFKIEENRLLKNNLLCLYECRDNILLTIKANELLGEFDRLFIDCRILSDIRIIFNEDLDNQKQAAVVVHQLKLDYVKHGESQQTFFALDSNDLRKLKIVIERALEKDKNIKSNVYQNDFEFIELTK